MHTEAQKRAYSLPFPSCFSATTMRTCLAGLDLGGCKVTCNRAELSQVRPSQVRAPRQGQQHP